MKPSIIGLIAGDQSTKAVSIVEKTLATKLRRAITEHKSLVARDAYGSLDECFGADDTPEFMDTGDNAYQFFFQNALKKFGVAGPQDFQDDNTKTQFFNYIDQNWKAQDSIQPQLTPANNIEQGTQTQLPPMAPPLAPPNQQAMPNGVESVPSMAAQTPQGAVGDPNQMPDASQPLNVPQPIGQDQDGDGDSTDEPLVGDDEGEMSTDDFEDDSEASDEDSDEDFDLEVGDDDQDDSADQDFSVEPEDEKAVAATPEFESDTEFGDEDAYTVDHNDFMPKDDSEDSDEDFDDEDSDEDSDEDFDEDSDDDSDEDSDDDIDLSVDDEDDEKKQFGEDYGFGLDTADDLIFISERHDFFKKAKSELKSDAGLDPESRKAKLAGINGGMRKHSFVQGELDKIKGQRDAMLKQLHKQRRAIKGDVTKDQSDKKAALQKLAQMAGESRAFFKKQAIALKSLHLQQDGDDVAAKPAPDMRPDPAMKESFVEHPNGKQFVHIVGNGPYSSRMFIGEARTKFTANHKTLKGAQQWATTTMQKHLVS